MPTVFLSFPAAPQYFKGLYIVIPAHKIGAVLSKSMPSGTFTKHKSRRITISDLWARWQFTYWWNLHEQYWRQNILQMFLLSDCLQLFHVALHHCTSMSDCSSSTAHHSDHSSRNFCKNQWSIQLHKYRQPRIKNIPDITQYISKYIKKTTYFELSNFITNFSDFSKELMTSYYWKISRTPFVSSVMNICVANSTVQHFKLDLVISDFWTRNQERLVLFSIIL